MQDELSEEEHKVKLSVLGTNVAIEGLSREEEDDLYSHLERVHGEANVDGVIRDAYYVKVSGISPQILMRHIAVYCVQNGKRVLA